MSSLGGIFDNGVQGMMAQSTAMGSVSGNIANLSTVGYKRTDTLFATLLGEHTGLQGVNNATKAPSAPSTQNGVEAVTRQLVDRAGSIQTTGNQFDLAIPGNGMFAFADVTGAANSGAVYGRAGNFQEFVPTTLNGGAGTTVNGVQLVANAAYLANSNGQLLLGIPVTPGTAVTAPTSTQGLVPIQVSNDAPFPGQPTAAATLSAVIPAAGANSVSTPISYIDSAGKTQGLTLTWSNPTAIPNSGATWTLTVTDSQGNTVGAPSTFSFDNLGTSQTPSVAISANGASFTVDNSNVQMLGNAPSGTTNGQALAVNTNYVQDGLPSGTFNGVQINPDGTVVGQYSGGATKVLYQIPLAIFASPNNLQALAGGVYAPTQGSGDATFGLPGNGASTLDVGAVEESNVDLSAAFTTMILTQQAYSSSAQVVQVANQMSSIAANQQT